MLPPTKYILTALVSGQNDWCLVIWRFGPQSHANESEDVFRLSSLVRWKFQEVAHVCYSKSRSWDQYKVIAIFWDNFQRNQGAWSQLSFPITVLSYLWAVGWVIENNPIVTFRFLQPSTSEELCGSQIFALEQLGSAMGHLSTTKCTLQKSR